jgi:small GTP-binding protein
MVTILNPAHAELLKDEKTFLADLLSTFTTFKNPPEELGELRQALLQLDELFLIVVAGEFNSGKSALINALLGERVLAEGVTPTTTRITLVKYGDRKEESLGAGGIALLSFPLDLLRELNFVDTPGTNAVIREHEDLTRVFIPRSDLVIFVTSADRPFTESERQFLEQIRAWGKKIVLVINKRDILDDEDALRQVLAFVADNGKRLLGAAPEIFAVSAKQKNGIEELVAYIQTRLDEKERLRLKFANPLGIAEQLLKRQDSRLTHEREQLRSDISLVESVGREMTTYEAEVKKELGARIAKVDNVVLRLQARGADFFDQKFRLTNLRDLGRGDRFRALFESQVLTGVSDEIDHDVQEAVNWLVEKDLRHWQQISSFLNKRRMAAADEIVGQVSTEFDLRRQALLDSLTQSAQTVVSGYDVEAESRELGTAVESSVAQMALVEVGAVGLGTAITLLVSSSAVDVTGVLFAGVIAILGFFIIPYKRQQAKTRFREKIETVRQNLGRVLTTQFDSEAERTINRLREGVAPYFRFVRGEKERLDSMDVSLTNGSDRLASLQSRVEKTFAK